MRIAIDCRWIFPKLSGIGKHTENLVKGLTEIDRENRYLFLRAPLVPFGIFSLLNQVRLPRLLRKLDVDIYHSTNFMIPLFMSKKIKVVITIHDLIPWMFPQYTPRAKKTKFNWLFKSIMRMAVRRADAIIAVSETTKKDIERCLGVRPEKINVVYNCVDSDFFNKADVKKEDYILFVGRADPYKNLAGLIKAYSILLEKYKIQNKLLVVGGDDPRYCEDRDLVTKLGLTDKVKFWGYAKTKDMMGLYRAAGVLVMPSFYEGFGLPAVEAMAGGTPVIVSNTPALKEVVGDSAVIVDPDSPEKIAEAIYKVISDKNFARQLIEKGKEHARRFTIENMAEKTVKIYESCFSS